MIFAFTDYTSICRFVQSMRKGIDIVHDILHTIYWDQKTIISREIGILCG